MDHRFQFDVIVVGAGPAGATCALKLARQGARVVVLERGRVGRLRSGESLSASARVVLEELQLWEEFLSLSRRATYLTRSFWGGTRLEKDSLRHALGPDHHVERARFDVWMAQQAVQAGAKLVQAQRVAPAIRQPNGLWEVRSQNGQRWWAEQLVDATGRRGRPLGQLCRIASSDRLVCAARWFADYDGEPSIAVETTENGWWYSAPTPAAGLVVMFFTDADLPSAKALQPAVWQSELDSTEQTRARVEQAGEAVEQAGHQAHPSCLTFSACRDPDMNACIADAVPIGDAALSFDPIAAQGLTFALRSGLDVAKMLGLPAQHRQRALSAYLLQVHDIFRAHLERRAALYEAAGAAYPSTRFWSRPRGQSAAVAYHAGAACSLPPSRQST